MPIQWYKPAAGRALWKHKAMLSLNWSGVTFNAFTTTRLTLEAGDRLLVGFDTESSILAFRKGSEGYPLQIGSHSQSLTLSFCMELRDAIKGFARGKYLCVFAADDAAHFQVELRKAESLCNLT